MDNTNKTDFIHVLLGKNNLKLWFGKLAVLVSQFSHCVEQAKSLPLTQKLLQITWDDTAIATNEKSLSDLKSNSPEFVSTKIEGQA